MPSPDPTALASLELLSGADPAQVRALSNQMELLELPAGAILGVEGAPGDTFWVIVEGEVDVTRQSEGHEVRVARAGPGTLVGELAVLRGQPRTATVRTTTVAVLAAGTEVALQLLLHIPVARERVKRLVSSRLAAGLTPVEVYLGDGTSLHVRPLLPSDRALYGEEIHHLSKASLRRRFFTAGSPSEALLDYLVDIDYVNHFAWVAFDPGMKTGLATARYVRTATPGQAEMAFETADEMQGKGVGTFLFGALAVAALQAGITQLRAYTQEDNAAMLKVFAKAGSRTAFGQPGEVVVDADPVAAAQLVEQSLRSRLARSVSDVVTAASLAPARAG
jgi:GNAT superfamily N-acetyltransferase